MSEKEICLDLSKKIKFSDSVYISLGTLLISLAIVAIQMIEIAGTNGWNVSVLSALWALLTSIRSGKLEENE